MKPFFLLFTLLLSALPVFGGDFAEIDQQARAYQSPGSIDAFSSYVNREFRSDADKARFIYTWITTHIAYNAPGFLSGNLGNNSAEYVLDHQLAVCDGYSELFMALAKGAGLECIKLTGHSKGYGFEPGQKLTGDGDHAWNAVKIGRDWQLVDATWGAGYLDDNNHFVFRYTDYFFSTPPEEFLISHFPVDSQWQLVDSPVSITEFETMANPRPDYFTYNLNLLNHTESYIEMGATDMIAVKADEDIGLMATLKKDGEDMSDQLFYQYVVDQYQFNLMFHTPGRYQLDIYARPKAEEGYYSSVIQFVLDIDETVEDSTGFPSVTEIFVNRQCALITPLEQRLPLRTKMNFDLIVPGAESVAIIYDGEWTFLNPRRGTFSYRNFYTRNEGPVLVLAKFPDMGEQYWQLLEYNTY